VRACSDDEESKRILERALSSPGKLPADVIVSSRAFLSRVLHQLNEEEKAIEQYA